MKTPLYELHKSLKARFTEFHGWEMPLQFSTIIEEVKAVRESSGIFDISHMGRLKVKGRNAKEILNRLTTNNLNKLNEGKVQYNLFTNEKGGIRDDVTIYMLSEEEFFICTNAANREKIKKYLENFLEVEDLTFSTVQIALQGKESEKILNKFFDVKDIKFYRFKVFDGVIVSRTGYTGEDGFEIYAPVESGKELYKELLKSSVPCGLGARDVLRIEAGFPLYGNEISEDITPLEADLDRFVDFSKDFVGKEEMKNKKVERKLFGFFLEERGVPRKGYKILKGDKEIGEVSSGTFSPTVNKGIGMAFVDLNERFEGNEVYVEVRDKRLKARLISQRFMFKSI